MQPEAGMGHVDEGALVCLGPIILGLATTEDEQLLVAPLGQVDLFVIGSVSQ
jgi:hypothetical protein